MRIPARLDGQLQFVPLEEILYITIVQKKIIIYTQEHVYENLNTISDFLELTNPHGFELLDRNNVVQVDKITGYDFRQKIVFFNEDRTRYCTVSGKYDSLLKSLKDK